MPKNVYICGLPRGGTTLATLAVGSHPEAYPMGETMYLAKTDPLNRACSCGTVGCAHAVAVSRRVQALDSAHALHRAYGTLDVLREPNKEPSVDTIRYHPPSTVVAMERLLQDGTAGIMAIAGVYRQLYGERAFVDNTKEAEFGQRLPSESWLPIVVTRDLRGVAHSVMQAAARKGVHRDLSEKIAPWRAFTELGSALIDAGAPHIQYEQLVAGVSTALDALQIVGERADLAESYTEGMLTRGYEHHMLHGNRMAVNWSGLNAVSGADEAWRGPDGLSSQQVSLVTGAIPEYFERFGYER
jgi:hypothetical protein